MERFGCEVLRVLEETWEEQGRESTLEEEEMSAPEGVHLFLGENDPR